MCLYRDINYVTALPDPILDVPYAYRVRHPAWCRRNGSLVYALNPMTGVVEGFRWALLGTGQPPGLMPPQWSFLPGNFAGAAGDRYVLLQTYGTLICGHGIERNIEKIMSHKAIHVENLGKEYRIRPVPAIQLSDPA